MAQEPQFLGPDNKYRNEFRYSTDVSYQFFTGKCDPDTADMQVAINNETFKNDSDYVSFEGSTFIIPNPSVYPDGLLLMSGENTFQVRSVLSNGDATRPAKVTVHISEEKYRGADIDPPTDIFVERLDRKVEITVHGSGNSDIIGYNFYGSATSGGGLSGYRRINPVQVSTPVILEQTSPVGFMTADSKTALNKDGSHVSSPIYFQMLGIETSQPVSQMTESDKETVVIPNVIKTDYHQALAVPGDVNHFKTTVTIEAVNQVKAYSFIHDRRSTPTSMQNPALPNSEFMALQDSDPIYYVATAVYFIDGVEYESAYSPEVAAAPLTVSPIVASLPTVSRQQIIQDTTLAIYRTHPEVDIKPGSVLRDTFIDPFASEASRLRFIIGFLQNCQAFSTLLAIDDPGFTGDSVPVTQSPYKQALKQAFFLQSDQDVQNIIDNAFDRLAATRGVQRRAGRRARGEVTIYVTSRPTTTYYLPMGTALTSGGTTFRTTSVGQITSTGAGSIYNPATGRYSTKVFVQADTPGKSGNLAAGQLKTIRGGSSGIQAVNEAPLFGGRDAESNRELATRCDRVLAGVDSGTYQGLYSRALDIPGVEEVCVVGSGHDLMMRDIDDLGRHVGGKVDIWLRGDSVIKATDRFAFSFELVLTGDPDSQFEPVGNLKDLRFRVVNSQVTSDNPIIEMIDNPAWGLVFKDITTGKVFDLTDVEIEAPDVIVLSPKHNTPVGISLTDQFMGTYRFRTSNKHIFKRQPVNSIISLTGDVSGLVLESDYSLFPGSPATKLGRSSEANSYIQVSTETPSFKTLTSVNEHVFLDRTEYLQDLGINPVTVHIFNRERTIEYIGPYSTDNNKDYTFISERGETPMAIYLTVGSNIEIGSTVIIEYEYDENFTVTYTVNAMVSNVQNALSPYRHITSDILTKEAIATDVDISATIVMQQGYTQNVVDGNVRTELQRFFNSLGLGQSVRQSDIINIIENSTGVSYVLVPLTHLAKADESLVLREIIPTSDYYHVAEWSTPSVDVYLLKNAFDSGTMNSGGLSNDTKEVSLVTYDINNKPLVTDLICYNKPPNINGVPLRDRAYRAFIIGGEGLWIPGYSDNETLERLYPFSSVEDRAGYRVSLTENRVLVALPKDVDIANQTYQVSYTVYGDEGVKNIDPSPVEYLRLGAVEFVYDEDKRA